MEKYQIPLTKQHTVYRDKNGNALAGVTTVLGVLAKPALYMWYYKEGKAGNDPFKKLSTAGDIGTIAHALIMCHLKGIELDKNNLVPESVSIAENCVLSYLEWEKNKSLKPILIEQSLADGELGYGGTVDLYAQIGDEKCLIDFKTSSGIYKDMAYQVAAYKHLLVVNNNPVDKVIILNIGKAENSDFATKTFTDMSNEFSVFCRCLEIYKLQKGESK